MTGSCGGGDLGAVGAADFGNLFVVGRDDHAANLLSLETCSDAVGNEQVAGKRLYIFTEDRL